MRLHSGLADEQFRSDFSVGPTARDEFEHLHFPRAEADLGPRKLSAFSVTCR